MTRLRETVGWNDLKRQGRTDGDELGAGSAVRGRELERQALLSPGLAALTGANAVCRHGQGAEQNEMKKTLMKEGDGRSEVNATRAGTPFGPFSPSSLCEGVKKGAKLGDQTGEKPKLAGTRTRHTDTSHPGHDSEITDKSARGFRE